MTAATDTAAALPESFGQHAREFLARPQQLLIGGERVEAADGRTFATLDPSSGREIVSVSQAGSEDVERAVKAAREALEEGPWASCRPAGRDRPSPGLPEPSDRNDAD